jgi:hypothetical protein
VRGDEGGQARARLEHLSTPQSSYSPPAHDVSVRAPEQMSLRAAEAVGQEYAHQSEAQTAHSIAIHDQPATMTSHALTTRSYIKALRFALTKCFENNHHQA